MRPCRSERLHDGAVEVLTQHLVFELRGDVAPGDTETDRQMVAGVVAVQHLVVRHTREAPRWVGCGVLPVHEDVRSACGRIVGPDYLPDRAAAVDVRQP